MEAIGSVRKVKSKIMDGVEKVVDRSKEMLDNKKGNENHDDYKESESTEAETRSVRTTGAAEIDSADHVNRIAAGVNLESS